VAAQREWFETNYYKVLGVPEDADDKQYHPDANPGSEERFKEISAAYDVLGDPQKRKEYDEVRRVGVAGGGFGQAGGFNFKVDDLTDLFGGLFRQPNTGTRRRTTSTANQPQRGTDLEAELHLSFEEAVEGVVTSVNVRSNAPCATCGGSGSKPGTTPETCPRCGGRGVLNDNQGLFSLSSPCPECHGRGTKITDPCPTCFGTGVQRRERQVKVRIQDLVDDGQRIRIKGRGEPGANGGPAGDLFVTVRVSPHPLFGRRGKDLTLSVPVTFPEAALGATITVPSLGNPVTLKVPPGSRTGKTVRVRGRGLRNKGQNGDLLVTFDVVVPSELSDAERKAVEALAKVSGSSPRAHLGV
jgi:molecular chaperone DnaJ